MVAGIFTPKHPYCGCGTVTISYSFWAQYAMVIRVSVGVPLIHMLLYVFRALGHEVLPHGELVGSIFFRCVVVSYSAFQSLRRGLPIYQPTYHRIFDRVRIDSLRAGLLSLSHSLGSGKDLDFYHTSERCNIL